MNKSKTRKKIINYYKVSNNEKKDITRNCW